MVALSGSKGGIARSVTCDLSFLMLALAFNTLAPVMTKYTQNAEGGYSYNKWCVYFFAELLKLLVAAGWSLYLQYVDMDAARNMTVQWQENIRYSGPAFFFFCQNNLSFIALMYLSSSAFQLLLNCRIVMVAISTVLILRKPVNAVEWLACILATTGAVQYNLAGCDEGALRFNSVGIVVMIMIASCAAGGNVYTQLVMQKKMDQPLMFQNAQLYIYGVIFNGVNWMNSVGGGNRQPIFGDFGWRPMLSVLFYTVYGLSISVVLKCVRYGTHKSMKLCILSFVSPFVMSPCFVQCRRFGAMTRTFINATAIVMNGILDHLFFDSPMTINDVGCFSVILCATYLYATISKDYKPNAPLPSTSINTG
eukprot:SAG31_NODE_6626_length_1945_cov_12.028376_1_plen_365_part_00